MKWADILTYDEKVTLAAKDAIADIQAEEDKKIFDTLSKISNSTATYYTTTYTAPSTLTYIPITYNLIPSGTTAGAQSQWGSSDGYCYTGKYSEPLYAPLKPARPERVIQEYRCKEPKEDPK